MGDSEAMLAQPSGVTGYESSSYTSTDNNDGGTIASHDVANANDLAETPNATTTGDVTTSATAVAADSTDYDPNVGAGIVDSTNVNLIQQEAATHTADAAAENFSSSANALSGSSQIVEYNASINSENINEVKDVASGSIAENGISADGAHGSTAVHDSVDGAALSAEEERLWSTVRANSVDFNAWTALIEETEKMSEGNILKIRKVYDAFLAEFPLCYGYWKKYADHQARLGSIEKVVEVYERAVLGVTYSVDMWLHYCVFAISTYRDPDTVRRLFERGLAYVGTDYLSFALWDKYIEYEYTQQDWPCVAMLFTHVLENPNQQLDRYFEGFKELVASRPLSELRTAEEAAAAAEPEAGGQGSEGEVNPNGVKQSSKPLNVSLKDAEELEKYIAIREELYKKAKDFDSKIIGFETAIRRPYFHVRPLNVAELENWHNYLDFIEGGNDLTKVCSYLPNHLSMREGGSLQLYRGASVFHQRSISNVVKLYERCLIACANYPEYWIRYVLSMEARGNMDLADNALARATQVFVKRQPEIHLFAARFKEQHGDIPGARAAYQLVHAEISPGLLEAIIKHANMEHRLGNLEDGCSLYEQAIAIEKGKEHSQTLPLLYAQYSRFLFLVSGKVEKAREILDQAVENVPLSKPLLEALIHLESIQSLPKRVDYLDSLVEKFIVPSPDNPNVAIFAEREELSSIFLEFLDLFGDARSIKKADDRHAKLFLRQRSSSESKKRHAEDDLMSDKTKLAKSVIPPSSAPSVMGAYPNAPNQWTAGYGVQPQAWPQVAQAQGQQWNPGYAQQVAYGAYSSYGSNYTQPQVPASVPQSAAYPQTYPTQQVLAQQSYAPAASAATLTPAQQPAAVAPSTYYGSYY